MKRKCLIFTLLYFSSFAQALTLEGDWKSNKDKTLQWNRDNRNESVEHARKMRLILGHHHLYYQNNKLCSYFEPYKIGNKDNGGFALPESTYKILAQNKSGFVIEETLSTKEKTIYMLIFESENTAYGVNLDTEEYGQPGAREYYSREESRAIPKWGQKTCYPL